MRRFERKHQLAVGVLLGIVIAVVVAVLLSAAGFRYPYRTVPRPPLPPGQVVPKSSSPQCAGTDHVMGGCLPHKPVPHISLSADITATDQGPDLSNNDPVYSSSAWAAIAAHNAFAVFKVNQGTYYNDRTAGPMAFQARAHGLVVGGYDFLDVCRAPAASEAQLFVSDLRADNLLGPGTLPPTGDAEYPLGSVGCNARDWIGAWVATVRSLTGRQPMIYTGAWWWNPHIGSWWPGGSLAWVSGYTSSLSSVPRPSGQGHIDLWQLSDHGFNGATYADLSVWLDGAAAFRAATVSGPSVSQVRDWIARRGGSLHAYYKHGCHQPVLTTGACGQLAWRVDHFQKLVDKAHGYFPRCFGHRRNLGAAECQIIRPAVAVYSRAVASSHQAFSAKGCIPPDVGGPLAAKCRVFYQRELYFQGRVNHLLGASRY